MKNSDAIKQYIEAPGVDPMTVEPDRRVGKVLANAFGRIHAHGIYVETVRRAFIGLSSVRQVRGLVSEAAVLAQLAPTLDIVDAVVADDFRELHRSSMVVVWSILDAAATDAVVFSVTSKAPSEWPRRLAEGKVAVADALTKSSEDLVRQLVRTSDRRIGINALEERFALIDRGGSLPSNLHRTLREIHALRNLVAHRASRVDQHFLDTCPWRRNVSVGDEITLTNEQFEDFMTACGAYLVTLLDRDRAARGLKPPLRELLPDDWPELDRYLHTDD